MFSKLDIQKVSDLPIEQVAEALGLKVRNHLALCYNHKDKHSSLHFNVKHNRYRCFVCDCQGDSVALVRGVLGLSFRDAVSWLAQAFGIILTDERELRHFEHLPTREVQPVEKEAIAPMDPMRLAPLVADPVLTDEAKSFLFGERHLDERVIRWCGISSTHTHLLIPYFTMEGKLQTIQWRYLGRYARPQLEDEPRFRFPRGTECHLYNQQILQRLQPAEALYVTEGCSDCWAALSAGHKAVAVPSATTLRKEDLEPIREIAMRLGVSLHIYPDDDDPGERLFLQLRELTPQVIRHQLPEGCKDYGEYFVNMLTC